MFTQVRGSPPVEVKNDSGRPFFKSLSTLLKILSCRASGPQVQKRKHIYIYIHIHHHLSASRPTPQICPRSLIAHTVSFSSQRLIGTGQKKADRLHRSAQEQLLGLLEMNPMCWGQTPPKIREVGGAKQTSTRKCQHSSNTQSTARLQLR